ncbi:MAG: DUF503 domain-containing protein [Pseudomonadota bacterium]
MVIGLGRVTLRLQECHSLKEKRKIVKSITGQIRSRFNASVAEVGANDVHQRAEIGVAVVGNDRIFINSIIDKIFNLVEAMGLAEVIHIDMEIMNL